MSETWRDLLGQEMDEVGDPGPVIAYAPDEAAFDRDFGWNAGPDVLAWTAGRAYFPVDYEGCMRLRSVPRDPQPDPEQMISFG